MNGQDHFSFRIPTQFTEEFYGVTFTVISQGLTNTKSDSVAVIQDAKIFLEFTPESSIYVLDVENQVYFEAFVDEKGSEHADISDASLIEINGGSE